MNGMKIKRLSEMKLLTFVILNEEGEDIEDYNPRIEKFENWNEKECSLSHKVAQDDVAV